MKFIDAILAQEVPGDLMVRANEAVNKAIEKERGTAQPDYFMAGTFALLELTGRDATMIGAIQFRMEALAEIMKSGEVRAWMLTEYNANEVLVDETLLRASAACPLHINQNDRFCFDAEEFRATALAIATPEGRA